MSRPPHEKDDRCFGIGHAYTLLIAHAVILPELVVQVCNSRVPVWNAGSVRAYAKLNTYPSPHASLQLGRITFAVYCSHSTWAVIL